MTQMEIDGGNPVLPRDVITSILIRLPCSYISFPYSVISIDLGDDTGEDEDEGEIDITVSFDIATELFTLMPMPPLPLSVINASYRKNLTVYGNKLAMLSHRLSEDFKSSFIHFWVMETCASRERWCWTKKITSSPYLGCMLGYMLVPETIWRNEIVCNVVELPEPIDQIEDEDEPNGEQKIVMFNYITNEFKTIDIRKFDLGYDIFNYAVPVGNMNME
ncbi:hypothetical protein K1719_025824 [Acacia pycnantha]|nr:hypothetical protein K1719_025824 [Acacia pycnantha]